MSPSNIARPLIFMGRVGSSLTQRRYDSSILSYSAAALRVITLRAWATGALRVVRSTLLWHPLLVAPKGEIGGGLRYFWQGRVFF